MNFSALLKAVESGLMPDFVIRAGIRRLLARRLVEQQLAAGSDPARPRTQFIESMTAAPIAPVPDKANEQHYELPAEFFEQVLGRHLKYSGCYFKNAADSLDDAEAAMLRLTAERAEIKDGQEILELGCGWGSLTLWIAEHFPGCRITAVSNSAPQREFISARCSERSLTNVEILTADMNDFETARRFDRVVSVEMFEHMRNWPALLDRIGNWLHPDGRLFVHVFCHREFAYEFETKGEDDWMGRHFFTAGIMPAADLLPAVARGFSVSQQWQVPGMHYARTAEAWLKNLDARRRDVLPILARAYGEANARLWLQRWRIFFMACAELFGYDDGTEWFVAHYLLRRRSGASND